MSSERWFPLGSVFLRMSIVRCHFGFKAWPSPGPSATFPSHPPWQSRMQVVQLFQGGRPRRIGGLRGSCGPLAHGSRPSPHVPPELFCSGLLSWSRPLDEAKLSRRTVQV